MKISNPSVALSALTLAIVTLVGATACKRDDGQMSDAAAAAAPKESASLTAVIDDTAITAKVKQRLASDQRIPANHIQVETNNGVVTLNGSVSSADVKTAAEDLTRHVADVRGVDDQIQAPGALENLSAKAGEAVDHFDENVSDAAITTRVKAQFAADDTVKATAIKVDTDQGVVRLKGQVASTQARERAVDITRQTDGVRRVDDSELRISQS